MIKTEKEDKSSDSKLDFYLITGVDIQSRENRYQPSLTLLDIISTSDQYEIFTEFALFHNVLASTSLVQPL